MIERAGPWLLVRSRGGQDIVGCRHAFIELDVNRVGLLEVPVLDSLDASKTVSDT